MTALHPAPAPDAQTAEQHDRHRRTSPSSALSWPQIRSAVPGAVRKLDPRHLWRSPVMFVVWIGSVVTTISAVVQPSVLSVAVAGWLWLTVLFGNLAEAVAEGRGKAQADTLRKARTETQARLLTDDGRIAVVPSSHLMPGDRVLVSAGEIIPGDGDVVVGVASVDESAITGESAPVIREAGGDRSAVTGGTTVLSDEITVKITAAPGESFLDKMIALVEGSSRRKTPNEVALSILLSSLTIIFLLAVATLTPMAAYAGQPLSPVVLVALLVCLIPTTIGALLSAIGIAGMDRLVRANVIALSGRSVEAAGDIATLLLDKTGTITLGNRRATAFLPAPGVGQDELRDAARLASLADLTPEGRSIVDLAHTEGAADDAAPDGCEIIEFTAQTRMSGVDLDDADLGDSRPADPQGRRLRGDGLVGGRRPRSGRRHGRGDRRLRRHTAGRGRTGRRHRPGPRRRASQGCRQARHRRPVRPDAGHGDQDGDDHWRQRRHRAGHRRRGRGRRLPRRSHPGGQDAADQGRAVRRPDGRDDR